MIDATVVIPTKNRPDGLKLAVESLRTHQTKHDYEIVVVDTGDTGESVEWALANDCHGLRLPGGTFAQAVNLGAMALVGESVVLLNDDTVSPWPWLDAILQSSIEAEVVGARLLYPGEGKISGLVQHAGIGFDVSGNPYHLWKGAPPDHPEVLMPRAMTAVSFACVSISRFLWDQLGGLDETYVNGYEDLDFCLRARESGSRISYEPTAVVVHLESQTAGRFDSENANKQRFNESWIETGRLYYVTGQWPFQP